VSTSTPKIIANAPKTRKPISYWRLVPENPQSLECHFTAEEECLLANTKNQNPNSSGNIPCNEGDGSQSVANGHTI